jgi:pimeloyl-ACP methyl ester carboxylesterase
MRIRLILSAGLIASLMLACSSSSTTQSSPVVISNYHVATNFTVTANPYGPSPTPAQLNYAVFTRYRYNPEPAQIKAILVLMPGFFGGAGDFDEMARTIVRMGKGNIEVWAVDRRSVLLDDFIGMQEAWNKQDPSIALGYYFSGVTINGKTYAGAPPTMSISYMSEWGIDMTLRDLNTIISLVPQQYRKTNVFLGGHSLGAFIVQDYAAYEFGDYPTTTDAGYNNIAGVILLDGGGSNLFATTPTEGAYLTGSGIPSSFFGVSYNLPSVNGLEADPSSVMVVNLLGQLIGPVFLNMFTFVQIEGMYALLEPNQLSPMLQYSDFQLIAFGLLGNMQFKATNQAMLGFAMDRNFSPISIMTATLGSANGPLTTTTTNPFFSGIPISQPTDKGTMTYTWNSQNHITSITDLAAVLSNTYTTMSERYFPTRLLLDSLALADYGPIQTTNWRYQQGMHVLYTPEMDAPVLAFGGGAGVEQTTTDFNQYMGLLPPARGCNGQPRTACGFDIHIMPNYTHLDVLLSDPTLTSNNVDAMIILDPKIRTVC